MWERSWMNEAKGEVFIPELTESPESIGDSKYMHPGGG